MSTAERTCWILTLIGASMAAAPFVAEDALAPMGGSRFAMAMIGLLVGLTCFICGFFFRSRERVRRQLLGNRDLLAHWRYAETEWRAFAGEETQRQATEKGMLLRIVGGIMVLTAGGFILMDPKGGRVVGGVLLATWVLCWLAARGSTWASQRRAAAAAPEARIGSEGLLLGDEFHLWSGWGHRFEGCAVIESSPMQMEVTYSTPGRYTRQQMSVRVPVPQGKESELVEVVARLVARR